MDEQILVIVIGAKPAMSFETTHILEYEYHQWSICNKLYQTFYIISLVITIIIIGYYCSHQWTAWFASITPTPLP